MPNVLLIARVLSCIDFGLVESRTKVCTAPELGGTERGEGGRGSRASRGTRRQVPVSYLFLPVRPLPSPPPSAPPCVYAVDAACIDLLRPVAFRGSLSRIH